MDAEIEQAYDLCRSITHRYGANFSVGFRFLPRAKRRAVYAAYAFCRVADDIADEEAGGSAPDLPGATTLDRLDAWQAELDRIYGGTPAYPIGVALADTLRSFDIPREAFVALIDGCRQDVVKTRYETFEELLNYCRLVAASISDISLAIFGYRTPAALGYGRALSTALQLTNVTRDIGDDLGRGRVYVPQEELRRFGVTEDELFARAGTPAMRSMIEFEIDRAEGYFKAAEPLLGELDFDARFPVLLMGGVYATVLRKLRHDPLGVLCRRLSLSKWQKLAVIASRLIRPRFV
ncbi:MAG: phytoene/squalene synthase family protein [Thermoanaerobaculia bacterium]